MPQIDETVYVGTVRQAIKAINPAIGDTAAILGWPATLDAVSTILMSLLIAAVGGDEARSACGRMYEDVAKLERSGVSVVAQRVDEMPQGRA